jgi:DNA-binding CsgD family transcriptional regulator
MRPGRRDLLTYADFRHELTIMPEIVDRFLLDCAAAALDVPLPRYMDWAFDALAPLLRFDSAGWGIGTHDPPVTHTVHLRGVPPAMLLAYEAGIVELDYIRAAAAAAPGTTINDFDIRDAFPEAAAAIDDRISAPFSIEQTLATSLPHDQDSGLQHLILLWRARRFDPFEEGDRQIVERCVPHMVAGYRTAQRLHVSTNVAAIAGQALADRMGMLHSFDAAFVRALRRRWPDWGGSQLPEPVCAALAGGAAGHREAGLRIDIAAQGGLFSLAATMQPETSLSAAELRVASLYADGLTFRQVAARLGIAPATARNHVQRSFAKLGVTSKVQLAARLPR